MEEKDKKLIQTESANVVASETTEFRAKTVCFSSPKGGSGKTTITATIGTFLSAIGKRILLIDADAATNGLSLFYLSEVSSFARNRGVGSARLTGVFESNSDSFELDTFELSNGLWLAPAAYYFGDTEHLDIGTYEVRIRRLIDSVRSEFHYILLDSQAGSDAFVAVSLDETVSDEVVIVSEYDPISLAGAERLRALFPEQLRYSRTWTLINKMLPEFLRSYSDFMEVGRYASPIPWSAEVVRSFSKRRLALDTERGNDHTLAIVRTIKSVLDEVSDDVDRWVSKRVAALRDPIRVQYAEAEAELSSIVQSRVDRETRRSRLRRVRTVLSLYLALLPGAAGALVVLGFSDQPLIGLWRSEIVIAGLIASAVGLGMLYFFVNRRGRAEDPVEDARLNRRQVFLQRRLEELETLMAADLEELVRSR